MHSVRNQTLIAMSLVVLLLAGPALAESSPGEAKKATKLTPTSDWAPPELGTGEMDRVELKSGETLYGTVEGIRDRSVYFDSDEFGDVDFNLSDLASFDFTSSQIFRLDDRNVMGTGAMRGDSIRVQTSEGEIVEFARSELVSVTSGGEDEVSYWSGDIGVDFSAREGNTDQIDVSGDVRIRRETGLTRFTNDYRGVYGELDDVENTQNHRASSSFDVFLTRRLFLTTPFVDYYRDEFQNIKHQVGPGLGIGYEFIKNEYAEWDASVGGSYLYTDFFEGSASADDFAVVLNTVLEVDVTSDIEIDSIYRVQIVATDIDKTNHHFETELSHDIWGPIELDVTFIWDRIEKPVGDDAGVRPDSDDYRLMVGLSVDF